MSENTTEVIVGGAVLAAAVGFLIYANQLTEFTGAKGAANQYFASFRSIQGVSVGTDVRMAGVKVGTVTDLVLNPETFRADASFTVASDIVLPDDTAVVVSSEGLLGGNFMELLPGGQLDRGPLVHAEDGVVPIAADGASAVPLPPLGPIDQAVAVELRSGQRLRLHLQDEIGDWPGQQHDRRLAGGGRHGDGDALRLPVGGTPGAGTVPAAAQGDDHRQRAGERRRQSRLPRRVPPGPRATVHCDRSGAR